jgi:DNA-binding NtrC family response regulator
VAKEGREGPRKVEAIETEAMERLVGLEWRANNVRELRNAVELACDLSPGPAIELKTVEKVLRIQRGEVLEPEPAAGAPGAAAAPPGLVRIERESFRRMLESSGVAAEAEGGGDGREAPFYRIYQEFAAKAIIEGLRLTGWKLRPAARLLGISPMKLRGELKGFFSEALGRAGGDVARVAEELGIPAEVLSRKASDFGIEWPGGEAGGPGESGGAGGGRGEGVER